MACYHPVKAWRTSRGIVFSEAACRGDDLGILELSCGRCIGCRLRRASDWSARVMHEAQLHDANCFVTLTYGRDRLPPGGSLCYLDFQLFMKRLRRKLGAVRFYMCGEYGPLNLRPHFHACFFGVDFRSDRYYWKKSAAGAVCFRSPLLESLWTHGDSTVQDLNGSAAAYCARYIVDKLTGDPGEMEPELAKRYRERYEWRDENGVVHVREPEFSRCSLKPGIGAGWFELYGRGVYVSDSVVVDGRELRTPKYYDKLLARSKDVRLDEVEFARAERGRKTVADSSPERLAVRERVHKSRVFKLSREFK